MEYVTLYLSPQNGTVNVLVVRKNIKNVHLKVFRNLEVVLSVPQLVPFSWIQDFLGKRSSWINRQVTIYKESLGTNTLTSIKNGTSVQMLGKDMRITIKPSLKNSIEVDEKEIIIFFTESENIVALQKFFEKWWRKQALSFFNKEADQIYEKIFKKYCVEKPKIFLRKMKTMWGSCTPKNSKITLNEYLFKANKRCIQYVILHELTHLLYSNHNTQFYDFMTIQMPDWQERKVQLDHEVVQGL